jgi:hypothetical protein
LHPGDGLFVGVDVSVFFGFSHFLSKINRSGMSLDWPNQPSLLTGRNIEVEWKHGKMYKGKVTAYNPSTKRFTILYDDQEEKEYDLFTKTFKIVSLSFFDFFVNLTLGR